MSLINALRSNINNTKLEEVETTEKKTNPLVGKTNPLMNKTNPLAAKGKSPLAKAKEEVKEEPKQEEKEVDIEDVSAPEIGDIVTREDIINPIAKTMEESKETEEAEIKTQEQEQEEKQEELKQEEEEKQEEEKPKKSRSRKSKAKATETDSKEQEEETKSEDNTIDNLSSAKEITDYEQAMMSLKCKFYSEEWENTKNELIEKLNELSAIQDMNVTTIQEIGTKLWELDSLTAIEFGKLKSELEFLASEKPEGKIEITKKLNCEGTNDFQRKKSGVLACMNYESPYGVINLYDLYAIVREKYDFYKAIRESISLKQRLLITFNSAVKMEDNLNQFQKC